MSSKILCFGEILWDQLPGENVLGGASLNFANRLRELGDDAYLVSRLGDDGLGHKARVEMARLQLPLDFVQTDLVHSTGTVPVTFANGQPQYVITPNVAFDYVDAASDAADFAQTADCVYFGTLAQRNAKSRQTLAHILDNSLAAIKFLDLNLRKNCYTADTVRSSIAATNILKLNDEECAAVAEMLSWPDGGPAEFAQRAVQEFGLKVCIVTLGSRGALAIESDGQQHFAPSYKVNVADTIGAGDAFAAGFVHKYLQHAPISEALDFGNRLGALAATKKGGTAAISLAEVEELKNDAA